MAKFELTEDSKLEIRRLYVEEGRTIREIVPVVGVSRESISKWLREEKLTRSISEISKASPWRRKMNASAQEAMRRKSNG